LHSAGYSLSISKMSMNNHPICTYFPAQVNMWNRPLLNEEIMEISECEVDSQGNKVSWTTGQWEARGSSLAADSELNSFCNDKSRNTKLILPPMKLKDAFSLCSGLSGYLPGEINRTEIVAMASSIRTAVSGSSFTCEKVWADLQDAITEGEWTNIHDWHQLYVLRDNIDWKKSEPDGNAVQNCALLDIREDSVGFEDVDCNEEWCAVCFVDERPNWTLKGANIAEDRNKNYIGIQNGAGEPMKYIGYSDFSIELENGLWTWRNTKDLSVIATMEPDQTKTVWPQGRKLWNLQQPVGDKKTGDKIKLLLSPCEDNQFTCDDATCIALEERCDLKPDCRDKSDETNCVLVQFPRAYRSDLAPDLSGVKGDDEEEIHLPITLNLIVESLNVDTSNMEMHTNLNLSMTWTDSRIDFWNLNLDKTLNR